MTLQKLSEYTQKLWRSPALWFIIGVLNISVIFVGAYLGEGSLVAVGGASLALCWLGAFIRHWS